MTSHVIISAFDSRENNAYTYNDITGSTITSLKTSLAGVDAILLRNVVSPIYFSSGAFTLKPSDIDREFMDRMADEYPVLKTLFRDLVHRANNPGSAPVPKDAATENLLASIAADAEKLVITRKQLRFLGTTYNLTRSNAVITGHGKHNAGTLVGDRIQFTALDSLLATCSALDIDIDVERCNNMYRVRSMADIEKIASTVSLNSAGLDIIPGRKTLGSGYLLPAKDVEYITATVKKLLRSENFKHALYIFQTKRQAVYRMHHHKNLTYDNCSWYGAKKLVCHNFKTVVLAGIPKINPNTMFATEPSQERSVLAYRRFHLLQACGLASVVHAIGISAKWLQNVLPSIPGVIVHPAGTKA